MTHRKSFLAIAAVLGGLFIGSGPAAAAEATTNLNVRSGPGTGYGVVDVLRPGQNVNILRTSGGWCYLEKSGPDGWASCRYLTDTPRVRPGRDRDRDREPEINFSFSIPGFGISIGDGRDFPDRRRRGGRVCFYEHVGFEGDRFCVRPGQGRTSLGPNWNDNISSIRVQGGAEAQVCEHNGFQGRCVVVDRNIRDLRPRGNDMISSIRVR